jgi:hypothetical protein
MRKSREVGQRGVFFDFKIGPWREGFYGRRGGVNGGGGDEVVGVPGEYYSHTISNLIKAMDLARVTREGQAIRNRKQGGCLGGCFNILL